MDDNKKLELHDSLLDLRNKFTAHGGGHDYEYFTF